MDNALKERLIALGLNDDQIAALEAAGAKNEAGIGLLTANEIKDVTGCGLVTAKEIAAAFMPTTVPAAGMGTSLDMSMLPQVPDDKSFLEMLRTGGVLKVPELDVLSAARAAVAAEVGLYQVPDILVRKMEEFAVSQDEPVGSEFYELRSLIITRNYGEALSAIPGVSGDFISVSRKRDTLHRIHERLWPSLRNFQQVLSDWTKTWNENYGMNMMPMLMMQLQSGGAGAPLPAGMMQPPDTNTLRDEAEGVINQINKVFAGTGIPVARALAYDANRIRGVLEQPTLPAAVGAANRDQMLKSLGVSVGSDYVRLERNVIRYALGVMNLPNVSEGNEILAYLVSLQMLGSQIAWDKLGRNDPTAGIGKSRRKSVVDEIEDEEEGSLTGAGFRG